MINPSRLLNQPMQLLDYFFDCNKIPVRIMDNKKRILSSTQDMDTQWYIDFTNEKYSDLFQEDMDKPSLCTFNNMEMYASFPFKADGLTYRLLAGPAFLMRPFSQETMQLITFYGDISREDLERQILQVPVISLQQFAGFLRLLFAVFANQDIALGTLLNLNVSKDVAPVISPESAQTIFDYQAKTGDPKEYSQELLLLNTVKAGNVEAIEQLMQTYIPEQNQYFSKNPLKQAVYHFVGTITLISRFAIDGGLEEVMAYNMSHIYIQKADACETTTEITYLLYSAAKDFASRVKNAKTRRSYPKPILQCVDYIYAHLHEPISLKQLADETGMNAAYLSVLFKQKTGVPLAEYIQQLRVSEAKNLLRFSDASLLEISQRLSFSSQSYFASVFKKYAGISPKQYRTRYYKQNWD